MSTIPTLILPIFLAVIIGSCGRHPSQGESGRQDSASMKGSTVIQPVKAEAGYTYEERQGRFLYAKYCAVCHGESGKGDGFNAFNLNPKPQDFTDSAYMSALSDRKIAETITGGGRGVGKSPQMPPWGGRLRKAEVSYLTEYVRALSKH